MQLIALKDFYKTPKLEDIEIENPKHEKFIHKGARFTLGRTDLLDKEPNKDTAALIAQLVYSGCVGDATDPKTVKAVEAELAVDKTRESTSKERDKQASLSHAVEAVAGAIDQTGKSKK
jgi:hypothetical protein